MTLWHKCNTANICTLMLQQQTGFPSWSLGLDILNWQEFEKTCYSKIFFALKLGFLKIINFKLVGNASAVGCMFTFTFSFL